MNILSSIVFGIALLGLLLVVNSTFNHDYDNSRPLAQETYEVGFNVSEIKDIGGNIISLHDNGSIIPAWIVSGRWKLVESPGNDTSNTIENLNFTANITMANIDGTNTHRHKLTDFKLSNMTFQNKTVILDGTISFTSSGSSIGIPEGLPKQIPIIIKIMNLRTISIDMDNKTVKQHFGNSPIYGKIV